MEVFTGELSEEFRGQAQQHNLDRALRSQKSEEVRKAIQNGAKAQDHHLVSAVSALDCKSAKVLMEEGGLKPKPSFLMLISSKLDKYQDKKKNSEAAADMYNLLLQKGGASMMIATPDNPGPRPEYR